MSTKTAIAENIAGIPLEMGKRNGSALHQPKLS
jgi:hypothetical protein